jgi:1,2-diacylglycerol 3-alpha-glucosyltransferase
MKCIAIIFTNYGPYHIERIAAVHQQFQKKGWDIVAIELARHEAEYAWQTSVDLLPFPMISVLPDRILETVKLHQLLPLVYRSLSKANPDVLAIAGYGRPAMLAILFWSIWKRRPAILLSATHEDDSQRHLWLETIKRILLKGYKAAVVGGQPQKRYLVKLGFDPKSIFCGYNTVGNSIFTPDRIRDLPRPISQPYFLAINRFIPKKNLVFLISCYAQYRQKVGERAWNLILCGDGELRSEIEKYITQLQLQNFVRLPGFLQQNELLPYYAHAGCFIHASLQEQWGLVVNEAMASGLPILVSNRCGCFEDLAIEGVNGFGFDPQNSQQLTDLMVKISSGELDLDQMGHASLAHIQKFSPDYFANGLMQAVEYTFDRDVSQL